MAVGRLQGQASVSVTGQREEEAIARVAMRVRQGGHNIPPEVIRRRFVGGIKNFHDVYRSRVDFWQWFDNSGPAPQLREEGGNP